MAIEKNNQLLDYYLIYIHKQEFAIASQTIFSLVVVNSFLLYCDKTLRMSLSKQHRIFTSLKNFFLFAQTQNMILDSNLLTLKFPLNQTIIERHNFKNPLVMLFLKSKLQNKQIVYLSNTLSTFLQAVKLDIPEQNIDLYELLRMLESYINSSCGLSTSRIQSLQSFRKFLNKHERANERQIEKNKRLLQKAETKKSHPYLNEYVEYRKSNDFIDRSYEKRILSFLRWLKEDLWQGRTIFDLPLHNLTPEIMATYSNYLQSCIDRGKYTPNTVESTTSSINKWLRWLEDEKKIFPVADSIPLFYAPKKQKARRFPLPFCEEILLKLYEIAPLWLVLATSISLILGCRSCELARLKCEDIDYERKTIRLHGKGDKIRVVPLPDVLFHWLLDHQNNRNPYDPSNTSFFLNCSGNPYTEDYMNYTLNNYLRKAIHLLDKDCKTTGFHTFRHVLITELQLNNENILDIMEVTGIDRFDTIQVYTDFDKSEVLNDFKKKGVVG